MSLQERGERPCDDTAHAQERILHRKARLRRWVRQQSQHGGDHRDGRLSGGPFRGLRADRRMRIGEELLDEWVHYAQARQDARAAKTPRPPPANAQLLGAINETNLSRDEAESFLSRSRHVARHLEKRHYLHVVRKLPESVDVVDVYSAARDEMRERLTRHFRQATDSTLIEKKPEPVREEDTDREHQEPDLNQHHYVEELFAYHAWLCFSIARTLCIRTGTLKGLAM
jgi:hypothetical protein